MSFISSITGIPGASQLTTAVAPSAAKNGGESFGSALTSAIKDVDSYQQSANGAINQFLQGNGELHNVALAVQRAEMTFDTAMQVRNKVVSAYQEIMKMQL